MVHVGTRVGLQDLFLFLERTMSFIKMKYIIHIFYTYIVLWLIIKNMCLYIYMYIDFYLQLSVCMTFRSSQRPELVMS